MKKHFVYVAGALALLLNSCGQESAAYKSLQARADSLEQVVDNYSADLQEADSLVAAVLANFQDISSIESRINLDPSRGELRQSEKDRIKSNMGAIGDRLRASSEALQALTQKLEASGKTNNALGQTIASLRKELGLQQERFVLLTQELERRDLAIGHMDSVITSQAQNIDNLSQTTQRQAENLRAQERELNTVRYCIGTTTDLKDMKVLVGGKINLETADQSYITTVDMRNLSQIPLMSKRATLLTSHPEKSYALIPDSDKKLTLNIKNPQEFWSASKLLVIQVD